MSGRRQTYGVKLVRGPFVVLPAHRGVCLTTGEVGELVTATRRADPRARFAIDLFSGAGGLSLGLHRAGFRVVLGADHYPEAVETHAHHFPGLSVDWDLSDVDLIERVAALVRGNGIDLVAGEPPCQPLSKAGRSLIRHLVREGGREPHDRRRDLWRSFMEVVRLSLPPAVLMENVPDMALDKEMFILRAMVQELEDLGYSVSEKVVDTWRYGVPQFRQRLILVALRDGLQHPDVRRTGAGAGRTPHPPQLRPAGSVGGRPVTVPALTLSELDAAVGRYIVQTYQRRVHPETGQASVDRWAAGDWLLRMPESLDELDLLLLTVSTPRKVQREGSTVTGCGTSRSPSPRTWGSR